MNAKYFGNYIVSQNIVYLVVEVLSFKRLLVHLSKMEASEELEKNCTKLHQIIYLFLFCLASERLAFPSKSEFLNCKSSCWMPKAAPRSKPTLDEPSEMVEPRKFCCDCWCDLLARVPVVFDVANCSLSHMTVSIRSKFSSLIE